MQLLLISKVTVEMPYYHVFGNSYLALHYAHFLCYHGSNRSCMEVHLNET